MTLYPLSTLIPVVNLTPTVSVGALSNCFFLQEKVVASVSTDSKQREEGVLRLVACEGLKDKINDKSKK